ncbi:ribosomal protein S18 acetylase RimI-like enzyme [Arthrobacter woluwensis]|uniref:GNAT family N-acetyltransferase n=1 Tax=Arthrobacter woluwensis TaxID=156980 RepID=UPI00278A7765|nr:GNAT family N-acetyltransferase [Arthrobacter woluwensis]MDQ0710184.1 ribosomal protein S18 acetylase RimI-like enzyme [Arthrobacter woluwensis]
MTTADFRAVQDLERAAGELFRQAGMASIADDEPFSDAVLATFAASGWAWVLTVPAGGVAPVPGVEDATVEVAGYAVGEVVDGEAHLEQLSVDPRHGRQGLGARLLEHFRTVARDRGMRRATLTTFSEIPWNAAYYARLGFAVLPESEWGPELRAKVAEEAAHGLDRWPRVVMAAEL